MISKIKNDISLNKRLSKKGKQAESDVLVLITASRNKGVLEYRVDCASDITNEEFEYYLEEVVKGICEWKPGVCEESFRSFSGTIKRRKKTK